LRFNKLHFAFHLVVALGLLGMSPTTGMTSAVAQDAVAPVVAPPAQEIPTITNITVRGNVRVEPSTIGSYLDISIGDKFDPALMDSSLKNLFATELFNDVSFGIRGTTLVITVVENPIINRIVFEGNKKLDNEDLMEEVRLRPRIVYTRAKVRADVQRMLVLYRNKGRFAAIIEPMVIQLEQNRVDLVFEIQEGPKTKVRRINFIGNQEYSDKKLRGTLTTTETRWWKIFASNNTYDPNLLAFDQTELRNFYLNEGFADFHVVSAVAELTPDRKDFFYTYVVEEGDLYEFGELKVESDVRDVKAEQFQNFILMREGDIYSIDAVTNTEDFLTSQAGSFGYAFATVDTQVTRDRENKKINITFKIGETPRAYIEKVNVKGNVRTLDRIIRREMRVLEGDSFNQRYIDRSEQRINRLNFFREVEITRRVGSTPDRMIVDVSVEEQPTGELNIGAGFSSLENFIFDFSIAERNLMGKGQRLQLTTRLSGYRSEVNLSFTEPYFKGRNIAAGFDIFSTKIEQSQQSYYDVRSMGGALRVGLALNEYWSLSSRYTLRFDNVTMPEFLLNSRYSGAIALGTDGNPLNADDLTRLDVDGDGIVSNTEKLAILTTIEQQTFGKHTQSILGYTLAYDTRDSILYPTRGRSLTFNQDFAGVGGSVRYLKTRMSWDWYKSPWRGKGWTFKLAGEAGMVNGLGDVVRTSDNFFIGGPKVRGFDILGIGPYADSMLETSLGSGQYVRVQGRNNGGKYYYTGKAELFIPLGEGALEMGLRASAFVDMGALWGAQESLFTNPVTGEVTDLISNNTIRPRAAAGIGLSWDSPFGPFRIDYAKTITKQPLDESKTLSFNVGYNF